MARNTQKRGTERPETADQADRSEDGTIPIAMSLSDNENNLATHGVPRLFQHHPLVERGAFAQRGAIRLISCFRPFPFPRFGLDARRSLPTVGLRIAASQTPALTRPPNPPAVRLSQTDTRNPAGQRSTRPSG